MVEMRVVVAGVVVWGTGQVTVVVGGGTGLRLLIIIVLLRLILYTVRVPQWQELKGSFHPPIVGAGTEEEEMEEMEEKEEEEEKEEGVIGPRAVVLVVCTSWLGR